MAIRTWILTLRLVIALNAWVTACISIADDQPSWPFVRGPNYDGHAIDESIDDAWPEEGPPVLWVKDLGKGYSSFVASGDRVFTQTQDVLRQSVVCLEADTGRIIWEYDYDWPYEAAGVYPGPRSTPSLYKDRLYYSTPDGVVGCLTQQTGKLIWSVDLEEQYGLQGVGFGYSCSPTIIDDLVILPVGAEGASIVALNAENGQEVWAAGDEPASYSPALPIELNGNKLVIGYLQNALVVHDRLTGELLCSKDLSSGYDEHSAWPIWSEPYLWISGPFQGGSELLKLSDDGRKIDSVWKTDLLSNDVCSSVLVDGFVYGFDIHDIQSKTHRPSRGEFRCIDFMTGEDQWSIGDGRLYRRISDRPASEIGQSSIVVAGDKLLVLNELGELILLQANSDECEELDRCQILGDGLTWTAPCLHKGRLYARNQSQAICVYVGPDQTELTIVPRMTTADLENGQYQNLASTILAVEPEYAFDVPSNRWFFNWFMACSAIVLIGHGITGLAGSGHNSHWLSFGRMLIALLTGSGRHNGPGKNNR